MTTGTTTTMVKVGACALMLVTLVGASARVASASDLVGGSSARVNQASLGDSASIQCSYVMSAVGTAVKSDADAGSMANPFGSLESAQLALKPGDTLCVESGTYTFSTFVGAEIIAQGTEAAPIAIKGVDTRGVGLPKFKFTGAVAFDFRAAAYVSLEDIEIDGGAKQLDDAKTIADFWWGNKKVTGQGETCVRVRDKSRHVKILRCSCHDVSGYAVNVLDAFYTTIKNNVFYRIGWFASTTTPAAAIRRSFVPASAEVEEANEYRLDIAGNAIFNVESHLYERTATDSMAKIRDAYAISFDSVTDANSRYRITENLMAFNNNNNVMFKYNPYLMVSKNTIYSDPAHPANGISDASTVSNVILKDNVIYTSEDSAFAAQVAASLADKMNDDVISNNVIGGGGKITSEEHMKVKNVGDYTRVFTDAPGGDFSVVPSISTILGVEEAPGVGRTTLEKLADIAKQFNGQVIGESVWKVDHEAITRMIIDAKPAKFDQTEFKRSSPTEAQILFTSSASGETFTLNLNTDYAQKIFDHGNLSPLSSDYRTIGADHPEDTVNVNPTATDVDGVRTSAYPASGYPADSAHPASENRAYPSSDSEYPSSDSEYPSSGSQNPATALRDDNQVASSQTTTPAKKYQNARKKPAQKITVTKASTTVQSDGQQVPPSVTVEDGAQQVPPPATVEDGAQQVPPPPVIPEVLETDTTGEFEYVEPGADDVTLPENSDPDDGVKTGRVVVPTTDDTTGLIEENVENSVGSTMDLKDPDEDISTITGLDPECYKPPPSCTRQLKLASVRTTGDATSLSVTAELGDWGVREPRQHRKQDRAYRAALGMQQSHSERFGDVMAPVAIMLAVIAAVTVSSRSWKVVDSGEERASLLAAAQDERNDVGKFNSIRMRRSAIAACTVAGLLLVVVSTTSTTPSASDMRAARAEVAQLGSKLASCAGKFYIVELPEITCTVRASDIPVGMRPYPLEDYLKFESFLISRLAWGGFWSMKKASLSVRSDVRQTVLDSVAQKSDDPSITVDFNKQCLRTPAWCVEDEDGQASMCCRTMPVDAKEAAGDVSFDKVQTILRHLCACTAQRAQEPVGCGQISPEGRDLYCDRQRVLGVSESKLSRCCQVVNPFRIQECLCLADGAHAADYN